MRPASPLAHDQEVAAFVAGLADVGILWGLIGVENEAAVAVFLSLRNHRAQRDALSAAAEKCLDYELKRGFDALISIHKRLDKQRNDVVHGVWGTAEKTPDGIVWSSLQEHANMLIRDYHNFSPGNQSPEYDRAQEITKDLFVVQHRDLEKLNQEIILLAQAIGQTCRLPPTERSERGISPAACQLVYVMFGLTVLNHKQRLHRYLLSIRMEPTRSSPRSIWNASGRLTRL